MVHYIINPWRFRHELLEIKDQFYPPSNIPLDIKQQQQKKRHAVALVSVWEQRGNCPHLVASTALLTAAMINDEEMSGKSSFCVRAAYSVAFSRFVTGLLDSHQSKKHKQSMYTLAKTINLPSTFVELRHQATHEDLPSLHKLRIASKKALLWIWDYYWKDLNLPPSSSSPHLKPATESELTSKLDIDENEEIGTRTAGQIHNLDALKEELRLEKLQMSGSSSQPLPEESPIRDLESLRREMMMTDKEIDSDDEVLKEEEEDSKMDIDSCSGEEEEDEEEEEGSGSGWDPWSGPWIPRPIGVTV